MLTPVIGQPIEAVFISDLHLSPDEPMITQRFEQFLTWVKGKTAQLYILGDFLQAWPGDDALDAWHEGIAKQLRELVNAGICCYFMPGNRDFLLGPHFAALAGWKVLSDPTVIRCGDQAVLLSHGDRYCTDDRFHQYFRRLTRNNLFRAIFTWLPLSFRQYSVKQARHHSMQANRHKSRLKMDVTPTAIVSAMRQYHTNVLIHGHTHRPQAVVYGVPDMPQRFVLSDWDDRPILLCYYKSHGFNFNLFHSS